MSLTAPRPNATPPPEQSDGGPPGHPGPRSTASARDEGSGGPAFLHELRLLGRGSSLGLVGQIADAFLAFAFSLVVAHLFRARGTGTFFEALAIFTIASNIGDLGADDGLNWTVPRLRTAQRAHEVRRLLLVACLPVLIWSTLLAAGIFVFAVPIAHLFSHGSPTHLASFLRILAPFVPITALVEVLIAGTRGFDRVWPLALIWSVLVPLSRLLLLPILLAAGLGFLAVAYSWAVPVVLGALGLLWTLLLFVDQERRQAVPKALHSLSATIRQFWVFSAPRALASICSMTLVWVDVLLVGHLISSRQAGIYAVASRYLAVVTFTLAAVGGTLAPQVSRLLDAGRTRDLQRLYQTGTSWIMAVAWPLAFALALFAPVFMRLFGREFSEGAAALTILALMMLYVSSTGNNMGVLVMSGRTKSSLAIAFVTVSLNIGLNLVLIPIAGIDGAAVAWAVSLLVANVAINVVLYQALGLHPFGPAFGRVAFAAVACIAVPGLILRAVLGPHWSALLLTAGLGGTAYLWLLWRSRRQLEITRMLPKLAR